MKRNADDDSSKRAGQLLLAYIVIWLLEGAARKWIAPSLEQALYFARLPVIIAIVMFFSARRPARRLLVPTCAVMALVLIAYGHLLAGNQTLAQAGLGIRLMVEPWLVPLCLAGFLQRRELQAAARLITLSVFPLGAIAAVQVTQPPTAYVNKLLADDASDVFLTAVDVVRATGTFTSSAGHSVYLALAVAAAATLAFEPARATDRIAGMLALLALPVMALTSGSRSALFGVVIVAIALLLFEGVRRPAVLGPGVVAAVAFAVAGYQVSRVVASDAIDALFVRLTGGEAEGEAAGRALGGFTDWLTMLPAAEVLGVGVGSQARGVANTGVLVSVEGELARWVLELGPLMFPLALLVRFALCAFLVIRVLQAPSASRRSAGAFLAAGLPTWAVGPVTGQGTVCGFAAITACCVLAATPSRPARGQQAPSHVTGQTKLESTGDLRVTGVP